MFILDNTSYQIIFDFDLLYWGGGGVGRFQKVQNLLRSRGTVQLWVKIGSFKLHFMVMIFQEDFVCLTMAKSIHNEHTSSYLSNESIFIK